MERRANPPSGLWLALAVAGSSAVAILAALGWGAHGEAIVLQLAQGAWATCF